MMTDYFRKLRSHVGPFFHGLFWPLTWLESHAASFGLLISIFLLIAVASVSGIVAISYVVNLGSSSDKAASEASAAASSDTNSVNSNPSNCNTLGIEIRGCITTYKPGNADSITSSVDSPCDAFTDSETVAWQLDKAATDPSVKAVVLEIDSSGGSPAAAEEIAAALKAFGKPSVAWVRSSADSAAYWIASAADTIIASETSDVGSIGVTYSYVDNVKQNLKNGLTYNQLTTGKYKDTGTPDRPLTADDRALIQRDLDITLQNFIRAVATNRHLSVTKVTSLADGSTMLGRMALRNGLIDQLGTKQQVWEKLQNDINEKPEVCWP